MMPVTPVHLKLACGLDRRSEMSNMRQYIEASQGAYGQEEISRKTYRLQGWHKLKHSFLCSSLDGNGSPPVKKEDANKSEADTKESNGTPEAGKEGSNEGEGKKSEDRSNEEDEDDEGDSSGDDDDEEDRSLVSQLPGKQGAILCSGCAVHKSSASPSS